MTYFRLRMMIEQFFDAVLTAQEERELCRYLRENDVPSELRRDKEVILTFSQLQQIKRVHLILTYNSYKE